MAIDVQTITKLRELTGAGLTDCKQALDESSGDIDKAIEILRKKGAIKAAKKSDRITKEGVIAIARTENKVAVFGLACETDFVALNRDFVAAVESFAQALLQSDDIDAFKIQTEEKIKNELVVKIGENIQLAAADVIEGEVLGVYLHSNKKVASVVSLSAGPKELAWELAMQATAMSPKYSKPEDVPALVVAKEKEIYREQLKAEGKPEAMWEKIIQGKLNKYYQEVCLTKQVFIKDDSLTVEKLMEKQAAETGTKIEVVKFVRYQI